jgi:cold shock CspA family protein
MSGRIEDEVRQGTVKFFCRSRGHGFIDDDQNQGGIPVFMHISDIEGEYIPRKHDRVRYRICPMPPRFDRAQAVHIEIIDLNPDGHHKWTEKETPEEMLEDREAIKEEAKVNELLIRHRTSSACYSSDNGGGTP